MSEAGDGQRDGRRRAARCRRRDAGARHRRSAAPARRHRPRHVDGRARCQQGVPHPAGGRRLAGAQRVRPHAGVHRRRDRVRRIGVAAADGGADRVAEPRPGLGVVAVAAAGRGAQPGRSPRIGGWMAMRYFEHTRLQATRRQLARLGIGELSGFMPDAGSGVRPKRPPTRSPTPPTASRSRRASAWTSRRHDARRDIAAAIAHDMHAGMHAATPQAAT